MRESTNKNKNNYYRVILIALAVVMAVGAIAIAMTVSSTGVTYADTATTAEYNQVVFRERNDLSTAERLNASKYVVTKKGSYESFEYIVGGTFQAQEGIVGFYRMWDNYAKEEMVVFGNSQVEDFYGLEFKFGDYNTITMASEYEFKKEWWNNYEFYMFFTLTDEKAFISYVGVNDVWPKDEYTASLDNIWMSFDIGSKEYEILYNFFATEDVIGLNSFSGYEQFSSYKKIEAPTREGYTFIGWFYDEACTRPYQGEPIYDDIKLYAGWEKITYKVFFDASGLVDSSDPNTQGLYDWTVYVGYGEVAKYENTNALKDFDEGFLWAWCFEDGTRYNGTPVYEDMHLYGRLYCTFYFDLNGSDEVIEPMEVEYGSLVELPFPTQNIDDRRCFVHWTYEGLAGVGDIQIADSNFVANKSTYFKAEWRRNIFTVTFYVDDEIWKQVDVEYGKSLFDVSTEVGVMQNSLVGYTNLNTSTPAVAFSSFVVEDDVAVYLSTSVDDNSNNSTNVVKNFFADIWAKIRAKIKSFFASIGQWIKNIFKK